MEFFTDSLSSAVTWFQALEQKPSVLSNANALSDLFSVLSILGQIMSEMPEQESKVNLVLLVTSIFKKVTKMKQASKVDTVALDKAILACFELFKRVACKQDLLGEFFVDLANTLLEFLKDENLVKSCLETPYAECAQICEESGDDFDELI